MTDQGRLTLLYVHGESIGYARMGTHIANELMSRGYEVYDDDGHVDEKRHGPTDILASGRVFADPRTNLACWMSVPTHMDGYWDGQHRAILTMWESRRLPESFRETLHEFQTVLVPSFQNVAIFSKYHDNVHFIPLGVDPKLWHYMQPTEGPEFRFLISGRGSRKGVDLAFQAFQRVFGKWWSWDENDKAVYLGPVDQPVPKLIMKSMRGLGDYYAGGVQHVTGRLSAEAEVNLYAGAHCYLQPSRGEGFGLQPLQALALGRPTILTGDHGHQSFAHLGIPITSTPSKADYFIYGDAGEWWEPDLEQLCEAMWSVYNDYKEHAIKARMSARTIAHEWTWSNTTDRFVEVLGPEMGKPYVGAKEVWHKCEARLYRIVTNKDWQGEIGGRSYHFRKGVEYWESADIKRIFFDNGALDVSCLGDDDHGLMPVQVAQFAEYRAHEEACPTCGQMLNSGVMKSDLIYEQLTKDAEVNA